MKPWKIEYTRTDSIANRTAFVTAPTAGAAIKKLCKKLRVAPFRIENVALLRCDHLVTKA